MSLAQPLLPTGHRRPGEGMTSLEEHRRGAALPKQDANTNKSFFGPGGLLKGAGSGRNKTGLDVSRPKVQQSAGRFQKARRRK